VVRPKRRWVEEVERELKGMGVKDCKDSCWKGINGRKLWRRLKPKLGYRPKESESKLISSPLRCTELQRTHLKNMRIPAEYTSPLLVFLLTATRFSLHLY
jgi:hypothetical protein